MAKVQIITGDPMLLWIRDEAEIVDLFGEEELVEEGVIDVPEELVIRYKKFQEELEFLQKELKKYKLMSKS